MLGVVSQSFIVSQLETQLQTLTRSGVTSSTKVVIFLMNNVVMSPATPPNTTQAFNFGFHSASGSPPQFYAVMDYETTTGPWAARDISVSAHEIGELMNDPLVTNATPLWGGIGREFAARIMPRQLGGGRSARRNADAYHHEQRLHIPSAGTRVLQLVLQCAGQRLAGRGGQILLKRRFRRALDGLPSGRDLLKAVWQSAALSKVARASGSGADLLVTLRGASPAPLPREPEMPGRETHRRADQEVRPTSRPAHFHPLLLCAWRTSRTGWQPAPLTG